MTPKPRVRFCWVCGKQLYGNHFKEVLFKKDGRLKIVHKQRWCSGEVNK